MKQLFSINKKHFSSLKLSFNTIVPDNNSPSKSFVFLHGLLGNNTNWFSIANNDVIKSKRVSYLPDLRNHTSSPHDPSMTYEEMARDVEYTFRQLGKFTLLGHSMGAKTAMTLACLFPQSVEGLLIIDSAPLSYLGNEQITKPIRNIVETVSELDVEQMSRKRLMEVLNQKFVKF